MRKKKEKKMLDPLKHWETSRNVIKDFLFNQEPFLTLKDVPDSCDGDQESKIVPMCSQQPYLSFTKGLGLIPSSISE